MTPAELLAIGCQIVGGKIDFRNINVGHVGPGNRAVLTEAGEAAVQEALDAVRAEEFEETPPPAPPPAARTKRQAKAAAADGAPPEAGLDDLLTGDK